MRVFCIYFPEYTVYLQYFKGIAPLPATMRETPGGRTGSAKDILIESEGGDGAEALIFC
jgi:hypothetical protein